MSSTVMPGTELLCKVTGHSPSSSFNSPSSSFSEIQVKQPQEGFSPLLAGQSCSVVPYLYSLYLEAKALPQCSCGQLYGLCSGCESG